MDHWAKWAVPFATDKNLNKERFIGLYGATRWNRQEEGRKTTTTGVQNGSPPGGLLQRPVFLDEKKPRHEEEEGKKEPQTKLLQGSTV